MHFINNTTGKDFSHKWNGRAFSFPAGKLTAIAVGDDETNKSVAYHFAKHLANREIGEKFTNKAGRDSLAASFVKDGDINEIINEAKAEDLASEEVVEEELVGSPDEPADLSPAVDEELIDSLPDDIGDAESEEEFEGLGEDEEETPEEETEDEQA